MERRKIARCEICNRRLEGPSIPITDNHSTFNMCGSCFHFLPADLQKIVMDISPNKNITLSSSLINALKGITKPDPASFHYPMLNLHWCVFSKDKLALFHTKTKCLQHIIGNQLKKIYAHYTFFEGRIVNEGLMEKYVKEFLREGNVAT